MQKPTIRKKLSEEEKKAQMEKKESLVIEIPKDRHFPKTHELEDIIKEVSANRKNDDPFYLVDLGIIKHQIDTWKRLFPKVRPCFAIKCNPNARVMRMIYKHDGGFDCASKGELMLYKAAIDNSEPKDATEDVIYANPNKQPDHILYAKEIGVTRMVCDNVYELEKLKKLYQDCEIVIRIKTDDSKSKSAFSAKFGVTVEGAIELMEKSKELGLEVSGVSFHVGSGCSDELAYQKALENVRKIFDIGKEKFGFEMYLVDIGGGFPGLHNDKQLVFLEKIAKVVNSNIERLFSGKGNEEIEFISEPGRYFVSASFTLVAKVIGKKKVGDGYHYVINDGIYGCLNNIVFDHYKFKMKILKKFDQKAPKHKCVIWGPTCDSIDKLTEDLEIGELDLGDWVYFKHFGAYTTSASTMFNGYKTSKFIYYWRDK